ncbi:MAG: SAM-dependent methyltransferase [Saprospiraceae bacterium]|nr:SAM-dependent methyltransferase [Saprospiraceae bacterium]
MSLSRFVQLFEQAFNEGALLKCTLSRPGAAAGPDLKNIYLRRVELKKGPHVAFTYRYKTRDEVKNLPLPEAIAQLQQWLGTQWLNADLFSTGQDATLSFAKNGEAALSLKKPAQTATPDTRHDRSKNRLLSPEAPWLRAQGITNARGEVLPTAQDKWRQINKFLEIIEALLKSHPLPPDAHIADMGSGKGYLTFALYDFLVNRLGMKPRITGIELRPALVEFCNKTAREAGFEGLDFIADDIARYKPERLDLLIALHACDTATDLALATGILGKAEIIVVAPCCHKQIRKELHPHNEMAPLLRHGILEERQAEILTDGIRALLLESQGYRTQVFEFISTEHTAKNVMITAIGGAREKKREKEALEKVKALKEGFGIGEHYLEKLL